MNRDGVSVDDVLRKNNWEVLPKWILQNKWATCDYECKMKRGSIEYQGKHVIISKYITIVKIEKLLSHSLWSVHMFLIVE